MRKLFIFFVFLLCCHNVHAEYVVIKQDMLQPSLIEHGDTYQALIKYPFPLNTNPLLHIQDTELEELCRNEQIAIENHIQKTHPSIWLCFIPKTLYELFFIAFVAKQIIKDPDKLTLFHPYLTEDDRKETLLQRACRRNKLMQSLHFELNQHIVEKLAQINIDRITKKNARLLCSQIFTFLSSSDVTNMVKYLKRSTEKIDPFLNLFQKIVPVPKTTNKILKKAISLEIKANKKGNWLLYRGTDGQKSTLDRADVNAFGLRNNDGLSYGNSLFAGKICGNNSCAFEFICGEYQCPIGYTLKINKRSFFSPTSTDYQVMHIPTFSTLAALFEKGEYFHPRTRCWTVCDTHFTDNVIFQKFLKSRAVVLTSPRNFQFQVF